jgi:hypothetical protein
MCCCGSVSKSNCRVMPSVVNPYLKLFFESGSGSDLKFIFSSGSCSGLPVKHAFLKLSFFLFLSQNVPMYMYNSRNSFLAKWIDKTWDNLTMVWLIYSAKLALMRGTFIIFTISLDLDLILFSDPDPFRQIILDLGRFGSGSKTLVLTVLVLTFTLSDTDPQPCREGCQEISRFP